jgi:hypothetical protein
MPFTAERGRELVEHGHGAFLEKFFVILCSLVAAHAPLGCFLPRLLDRAAQAAPEI